jgi:hypothetical protein
MQDMPFAILPGNGSNGGYEHSDHGITLRKHGTKPVVRPPGRRAAAQIRAVLTDTASGARRKTVA